MHVGLENNEKLFDLGQAERFDTAFGRLEHRRLTGLHLALAGDGLGFFDIGHYLECVARLRNALEAEYLDRSRRRRFGNDLAPVREHRPDLAVILADDERVADAKRSLLDKRRGDRTASLIELGFEHHAGSTTGRAGFQVQDIRA